MKEAELPASGEVRARPHGCRDEGRVCTHILCPLLLGTHSVTPLKSWKPQGCPTRPLEKPAWAPCPLAALLSTHTHTNPRTFARLATKGCLLCFLPRTLRFRWLSF